MQIRIRYLTFHIIVKSPFLSTPPEISEGALYGWSAGTLNGCVGLDISPNPILLPATILNSYLSHGCNTFSKNASLRPLYLPISLITKSVKKHILINKN